MKNIGIIRKIDKLGRIVIPKEVRQTLMIKEDDNLELIVDNENIILKKYSYLRNISSIIEIVLSSIKTDNLNVIIYDSTSIIGTSKLIINNLTCDMLKYIPIYHVIDEYGFIDVVNQQTNYFIKPIISNGVFIANILVLSNTKLDKDKEIIDFIASFLGKYMEI